MNLEALNQKQLATLLGLTTRQMWVLQNEGLPSEGLGKERKFVWRTCFEWYIKRKVAELTPKSTLTGEGEEWARTLTEQQTRKTKADAERAEIKLAKERGEVVEVERVKQDLIKAFAIVRNRALGLPTKVAPLIAVNGNLPKVKAIIEAEVIEFLTGLSQESI